MIPAVSARKMRLPIDTGAMPAGNGVSHLGVSQSALRAYDYCYGLSALDVRLSAQKRISDACIALALPADDGGLGDGAARLLKADRSIERWQPAPEQPALRPLV